MSLKKAFQQPVVLGTDSQASIKALDNQKPHPAHYLIDRVHNATKKLHTVQHRIKKRKAYKRALQHGSPWTDKVRNTFDLQLVWTPGHLNFAPNEQADEIAKLAAQGSSSPPNLLPPHL
jgi:ribonuclease HI